MISIGSTTGGGFSHWSASPPKEQEPRKAAMSLAISSRWIFLAFLGRNVQKGSGDKSLCGCRGRVPNPGQAQGLAGWKRTCWLPDEIKTSMKTSLKDFLLRPVLIAILGWILAGRVGAQTFTTLHSFTASSTNSSGAYTNSDGANPHTAFLLLSGNTLYGTATGGGSSGNGTVFAVNTNGTGFTNLYSFAGGSDGAYPDASVILSGNSLYGNAAYGGSSGNGTVFAVNTNGTGFTNLYSFTAVSLNSSGYPTNSDGANPKPGLILSGNTLYGTATSGGSSGNGTVFSLSFPSPQLTIKRSGTNVNLTWPSGVAGYSYSGYTLQCTTNLLPTAWNPVSPAPVLVNTNYAVTNAISGTRKFYRLSQ